MKQAAKKIPKAVGFDLDGVIVDHVDNKIKIAKSLGFNLCHKETATDILHFKIPPPTYEHFQYLLFEHPEFAMRSPLMNGAGRQLEAVRKLGLPYFLISRRKYSPDAIRLMERLKIWPRIFNAENTFFVKNKAEKDEKAKDLGIEIYIDDQPSVLEVMTSVPHRFLFDPLGAYSGFSGDYEKVSSWKEFVEKLQKIL